MYPWLITGVQCGAMDRGQEASGSSVTQRATETTERNCLGGTSVAAWLECVPVFASLEHEHVEQLSAQMIRRDVAKGDLVTVEGQSAEALYVVAFGHLKRFKVSADGHEQILKFLHPGESFGEVPLLDGGPDPASVQAIEPSVIYALPRSRFEQLVRESPDLALGLIRFLAGRIRHLTELVEDLSFLHRVEHVAKLLLEQGVMGDLNRLTQSDMAAATGTAREVVGRALRELEQRGAIQVEHGYVTVLDRGLLEFIAKVAVK
jgi:CRP/FNR family cyclic AMP-dependent transcriptional regulator